MKSQATKFILCVVLIFLSSCNEKFRSEDLQIQAEISGQDIYVIIRNLSNNDKNLINPLSARIPGRDYGVEIDVRDNKNNKFPICAMVEPSNFGTADDVVSISSGGAIEQKYNAGTIKRRFCLTGEKYKITFVLVQPESIYRSNEITLVIAQ